jgi:thiamine biosynthesis lipoprotein
MYPKEKLALPEGLSREQFSAMGTTITLLLPEKSRTEGLELVSELFEQWESQLSRFRPESELSHLNRLSGKQAIVSDLLFKVLKEALLAAQASDGIYDPTLLPQLSLLGYDRSFDELSNSLPETGYAGQAGGAWKEIRLDGTVHGVLLPQGVQIDFGGIAKGMAVDAAIALLQQAQIQPALVNAGGDLKLLGLPSGADAWSLAIPGKDCFWNLPIRRGAVATSGIARRNWQQGKDQRHHLLDPRTGLPTTNNLWSVTVVAESCEQAEVAAKVAFILGSKQGKSFLQQHQLAGLFVFSNGRWESGGEWPEKLMRRLA